VHSACCYASKTSEHPTALQQMPSCGSSTVKAKLQ
jgi:hypothetical protein